MSLSKSLRSRKSVDYKKLNDGEDLPRILLGKHAVKAPAPVLPDSYSVERIIDRKETSEGTQFLVKWVDYHKQDSTWEPACHLPTELTVSFLNPDISKFRLQQAADNFEYAVQQRLSSKQSRVLVNFELDVFRFLFNSNKAVVINGPSELDKLPMCVNWFYKLNKHGKGVRLSFPIRITPRLYNKRVFVRRDGVIVSCSNPIEKLVIICATEPFV